MAKIELVDSAENIMAYIYCLASW